VKAKHLEIDPPTTVHELKTAFVDLTIKLTEAHKMIQYLGGELRAARTKPYKPKGEGLTEEQLRLFKQESASEVESEMLVDEQPEEDWESEAKSASKSCRSTDGGSKQRIKPGRKPFPDHLPRKTIPIPIAEEELTCECCGRKKTRIGEEASEQLEYIPASIFVMRFVRAKYSCSGCAEKVTIAPVAAKPVPKGTAGSSLIALTVTQRFADHLPWYRQESITSRFGHQIKRSTQWSWAYRTSKRLQPLCDELKRRVMSSSVIWTDDSPVKIRDPDVKKRMPESRMWTYRGDSSNPYIFFDFTRTRKRDGPQKILNDFNGYLVADAYKGYDCVYASGDVIEAACFAHVRRKFFEAVSSAGPLAVEAILLIRQLYRVEQAAEKLCAKRKLSIKDFHALRLRMRKRYSESRLKALKAWLDHHVLRETPKSRIMKAIKYALNNWNALTTFMENGEVTLDNNYAENILRRIAIGRKNWLFFGGEEGGRVAAVYATIITSALRHGLDPYIYLRDVIQRLTENPATPIQELLPDNWEDKTSGYFESLMQIPNAAPQ